MGITASLRWEWGFKAMDEISSKVQVQQYTHYWKFKRHTEETWEVARQYLGLILQLAISWIKTRGKAQRMTPERASYVLKGICTQRTAQHALQLKRIGAKTMTCQLMDKLSRGSFPPSSLSLRGCSRKYCQMMMGLFWWFRMCFLQTELNQHTLWFLCERLKRL